MPVSREQFEEFPETTLDLSEGSAARRVLSFLDQHAEQAFTRSEIADETGVGDERLDSTLRRLEGQRLVEHREEYWAIGDESRIGSLAGMSLGWQVAEDRFPPEDKDAWDEQAVDPRE